MKNGCKLGIDSWADTCCAGKHAHIESFVEGRVVNVNGFSNELPQMESIPIANVKYAYDSNDGKTYILTMNNAIYLGNSMENALICPNQCRENGIQVDTRPKYYYPDEPTCQSIFDNVNNVRIPLEHHGPLPYIPVRRPTNEEILTCDEIVLTSTNDWDPYDELSFHLANVNSENDNTASNEYEIIEDNDDIFDLMGNRVLSQLGSNRILTEANNNNFIHAATSVKKDSLSPSNLSKLWRIGLKTAQRTLKSTSHQCIKTAGDLHRRFRTDKAHMRYKRMSTKHGKFYVDTLFSKVKSVRGYTCGNLYTNNIGFRKFYPMVSNNQDESTSTLRYFIEAVGLPHSLHADNHTTYKSNKFRSYCKKYHVPQTWTEPYSPWQNRAESGIKEVKSYAYKLMESTQTPIRLWCFAFEYAADLLSLMATGLYQLDGRTPYEVVHGYTPDISEYTSFRWYQWAYYWDEIEKEKRLCRWLGPAHNVGQSMCYYVLKSNGEFIARSTVIPIPDEDLEQDNVKELINKFTTAINDNIGNHTNAIIRGVQVDDDKIYESVLNYDKSDDDIVYPWDATSSDTPTYEEEDELKYKAMDEYIGAHITMQNNEGIPVVATVKGRKRDNSGQLIGKRHHNPILDTRIFHIEYPDGRIEEVSTNLLAEALYSEIDEEGNNTGILHEISDYRKNESAIPIKDGLVMGKNGQMKPVITTKGWELKIIWKDGTTDWLPLSEVKESDPIKTAEFAIARGIENEPAFNWWAKKTLRKRDRIITKVKTYRMKKPKMKFGIQIPNSVEEALKLDQENNNTFWYDAIQKEMENVKVAFKPLEDDERVPVGYKEITCHMNFEVKMDLRRKARYVAGGHLTDPPTSMTYSSVVSRESVRIAFLIAALNDLDVLAGDIQNAYLNAQTKEKLYIKGGPEWGKYEGKSILIVRALYGLKSSGKQWRMDLADKLQSTMGFKSCLADPDVWFKPMTKPDGSKYYAYILVYVDDILIIDENPKRFMDQIEQLYTIKKGSVEPPKIYLGANIQKVNSRGSDSKCWGISAQQYVRDSVKNIKARMKQDGFEFNKKLSDVVYSPQQPFSNNKYKPELDTSPTCTITQFEYYQNLIGILRWCVELGRIDIAYEVSCLSSYLANPRLGHLHQALHVFKYLEIHQENFISFDPTKLELPMPNDIEQCPKYKAKQMKEFYPDATECIPLNAPEARGEKVQMNVFVDADHAGNVINRRSQTGILMFLNMAPIYWYSKKQTTVESSTFSSEFVALKVAVEMIISMRYKLRMMGVPLEGPARIFCDNEAVYKNASFADSTLKKKHNSIAYHRVRESVAAGICYVIKEDTGSNLADILTKSLPKQQRVYLRERIMINEKVKDLKSN